MDFEQIKNNLLSALGQLLALRVIVTSPSEKVADLPAMYVLLAALMAPGTSPTNAENAALRLAESCKNSVIVP